MTSNIHTAGYTWTSTGRSGTSCTKLPLGLIWFDEGPIHLISYTLVLWTILIFYAVIRGHLNETSWANFGFEIGNTYWIGRGIGT